MQVEIIRDLTKTEESKDVTSGQILAWAKREKAQKGPVHDYKQFKQDKDLDKIKTVRRGQRQIERKLKIHNKVPVKYSHGYCSSSLPPR